MEHVNRMTDALKKLPFSEEYVGTDGFNNTLTCIQAVYKRPQIEYNSDDPDEEMDDGGPVERDVRVKMYNKGVKNLECESVKKRVGNGLKKTFYCS